MRYSILSLLILTSVIAGGLAMNRPKPSKWETMSVKDAIERLESTIQKYEPEFKFKTQPLPADQIAKLKRELHDAPRQYFELLEIMDYESARLFPLWRPVAYEELKDASKKAEDFHVANSTTEGWRPDKFGCCKSDKIWRKKWLPIVYVNGNEVFIDMDPSENGIPGQIAIVEETVGISGYWDTRSLIGCIEWPMKLKRMVSTTDSHRFFAINNYHPRVDLVQAQLTCRHLKLAASKSSSSVRCDRGSFETSPNRIRVSRRMQVIAFKRPQLVVV